MRQRTDKERMQELEGNISIRERQMRKMQNISFPTNSDRNSYRQLAEHNLNDTKELSGLKSKTSR